MASAEQIKALLKSHIDDDNAHFFSVAMQVSAHKAKLGHGQLADTLKRFLTLIETIVFKVAPGALHFLERTILLMHGRNRKITGSLMLLNSIAALRRAQETTDFFDDLSQQTDPHNTVQNQVLSKTMIKT